MDDRKSRILQAIVEDYVASAEPVGSRTIARKYQLGFSPATIRNEMADLEELGYLEQPHTSAGRVPSSRGYRYYVDCLMDVGDARTEDRERINRTFERKMRELNQLIRETARVLSETSHLTSVVTGPQTTRSALRDLHLVPIGEGRAILIYVTDSGLVENQVVDLPPEITLFEMQRVSSTLTGHLRGVTLDQINPTTLQDLHRELVRYEALLDQIFQSSLAVPLTDERRPIVLGGTRNMLEQPEFRDVEKMRGLLAALDDEGPVADMMAEGTSREGVSVQIGEEIRVRDMHDCSLVSATYSVGDRLVGRLGIIGPKRMEYGRVVGIVSEVLARLNNALTRDFPG